MLLNQFEKTYNLENGYIGPYEHQDGRIIMSKQKEEAGVNGGYWRHEYFTIYKCKYCDENAMSTQRIYNSIDGIVTIPVTCSRYSECFAIHAGIQIAKDHVIHTRENPGIHDGYYCWREQIIDKNGNKISTGDGNKRKYVYLHRIVMEEYLDRKLESWEIVHHIDMIKINNDLSNLWLCNDSTHEKAHRSAEKICTESMYRPVQTGFNRETGEYYIINQQ